MKKFKFLVLVALAVIVSAGAFAQKQSEVGRPSLSVGVEGALPLGDFKTAYNFGIGGSLKAAFPVASDFDLTLTAGYITFSGKTLGTSGKVPAYNTIPIKVGARLRFAGGPYVEPQLGYTSVSSSAYSIFPKSSFGAFTYAANVGYMFSPAVDLGLRYEAFSKNSSTTSFIGARLAYSFSL
jgi:hypothetical protein